MTWGEWRMTTRFDIAKAKPVKAREHSEEDKKKKKKEKENTTVIQCASIQRQVRQPVIYFNYAQMP